MHGKFVFKVKINSAKIKSIMFFWCIDCWHWTGIISLRDIFTRNVLCYSQKSEMNKIWCRVIYVYLKYKPSYHLLIQKSTIELLEKGAKYI